jgi:hypothetical protein
MYISNVSLSGNTNYIILKMILFDIEVTCMSRESIVDIGVVSFFGFRA